MQLPPPQVTRAVIQRYARLRVRYAAEFGPRPLVLPDATFFPDTFQADLASLERITHRMQEHAGMADIPIRPVLLSTSTPTTSGSCSSGACSVPASASSGEPRVFDEGEGWRIQIPTSELRHSVALTTNLARSLAFIFLVETQREGEVLEPPVDVTADLVATALGFGPLLLQGAYIYAKSCGGPQIARVTEVKLNELAIVVAIFAALEGHPIAPALKLLDTTQKTVLSEAQTLIDSNRNLIERLRRTPEQIAHGQFELEPPGSVLTNWLKKLKRSKKTISSLQDIQANMDLDEIESLLIDMPPSSSVGRSRTPSTTSSSLLEPPLHETGELERDRKSDAIRAARV